MFIAWCKFAAAALCLCLGLIFMVLAVFGVNRFHKALNRMHAAAMGDTLGILFVFMGLMIIRGFSLDSLKLFLVILFFWMASPVSGHMISRLEAMTDEHLGEIQIIDKENKKEGCIQKKQEEQKEQKPQESQKTQRKQEAQESQKACRKQEAQRKQEVQESQKTQRKQEAQESQKTQRKQEAQEKQIIQEKHEVQKNQKVQAKGKRGKKKR